MSVHLQPERYFLQYSASRVEKASVRKRRFSAATTVVERELVGSGHFGLGIFPVASSNLAPIRLFCFLHTSQLLQPKAAPAAPAAAAAPAPSPAPTPAPAAPAAPAAAPAAAAAPNADHVRQLTEMGFPEDQATAALRAAMGNPDVAVEFLMTGIPDNVQVQRAVFVLQRSVAKKVCISAQ